ncbi:protein of unknown function [Candidatus Promineifilum breve]|uniref:Uncharacterized protein n=1 Tax=Candidatus Promineifilum breve TaxID=1806508 RepID=A0A170PE64_9CHLR|nr:protein of unknown function [Candidatus Promineifilum breve]
MLKPPIVKSLYHLAILYDLAK